ncbi:MAG: aminotransferase class I/II-fold pyridoxal phosphate-dependent enzyme [Fibrobacter sp.]|nr:aminotransferase class I/II-fold pyridoxal phosphate-dependent enzyme [Fibrobacter sp.]
MTEYEVEMALAGGVNLSYWNPGSEYKAQIKDILKINFEQDIFDYQYYIPERLQKVVATKLGFSEKELSLASFSAFSQSTVSIVTVSAFLAKKNLKLGIVSPVYFSVQTCCNDLKIPYVFFDEFAPNVNESFDEDLLLKSECDAFWFTSPINSTSIYFSQKVKEGIQKLLDFGKWVFLDESLCVYGKELLRTFGIQDKLFYIYSPHKTLGIQGVKFSVVVAHRKYYNEIDCLKDCYGGSLNCSNLQGVTHFASPNFDECVTFYNKFWRDNLGLVKSILTQYDFAHVSSEIAGHYAMIFMNSSVETPKYVKAMKVLMQEQGYYVYPGFMQGFDTTRRFCFRVNLLLNKVDLEKGLVAVLDYFKNTLFVANSMKGE